MSSPTSLADAIRDAMTAEPKRYQVRGIRWMDRMEGRGLLADDMGLGKTYQTIAWLTLHPEVRPAVIICPATLKYNWQKELQRFAGLESQVIEGKSKHPLTGNIWILNYDIMKAWLPRLLKKHPKIIVPDECHKLVNLKAQRTVATRTLAKTCENIIGLSGTPIKNRPAEFFSILNMIAPDRFPSWHDYAFAFCNPRMGFRGQWDFRGASNLDELHAKIAPIMLRRTKEEVLPELPQTINTHIPVKVDLRDYHKARDDFLSWLAENRGQTKVTAAKRAEKLVWFGELRRLVGRAKLPAIKEWIRDWFEDNNGDKLVVFATHKIIVQELKAAFPNSVMITGETCNTHRQRAVDTFQTDPSVPLFIGNLQAAGEGTTLTASSTVLHAELSWVPGDHEQAADRVNRIGQTANRINSYYIVAKGTIEEMIVGVQESKRDIVSQIITGKESKSFQDLLISKLIEEKETQNAGQRTPRRR